MSKLVDARGLQCPQPVMLTQRALQSGEDVTCIVDSPTARDNIINVAEARGYGATSEERQGVYYVHLSPANIRVNSHGERAPEQLVLLISSEVLGKGNDELGQLLMRTFLQTMTASSTLPETAIFLNSGVKLVSDGSPVLEELQSMEATGVRLLACGTCLSFYDLKERVSVGQVSNMFEIVELLQAATRVLTL